MKVGIAGVGGIGSNVAVNLVRSGITSFLIVDFDQVEVSNLNRQFYFYDQIGSLKVDALSENLKRINPEIVVEKIATRIDTTNIEHFFASCDVLVEGFDGQSDKKMLLEHLASTGKQIVSANGIAGDDISSISKRTFGNIVAVGDFTTDCNDAQLYSHKVIAVAAYMTEIILTPTK